MIESQIPVDIMKLPIPSFKELPTQLHKPARCVDGRPDFEKTEKGPQMLGGSLHPYVIKSLYGNGLISELTLQEILDELEQRDFNLGGHRDNRCDGVKCGCGFADRLPDIIRTTQTHRSEITERLSALGITNIDPAYDKVSNYNLDNITVTGENLIKPIESKKGTIENLNGLHEEQVAFVNLRPNTTLDTNNLNREGKQAFNLDLWAAVEQSKELGVPEDFARDASLILYMATEMVLVEKNGKPALPVQIHK